MRFTSHSLFPDSESELHVLRHGRGEPLLLVHGMGGNAMSWTPVLPALAARREVIAVDLPGSGDTPALEGENSLATFVDALSVFLQRQGLTGVDAVGSSMGATLVLELARRGLLGATVALSPGGFCSSTTHRLFFHGSMALSVRMLRLLKRAVPWIAENKFARTLLLQQLSAHPGRLAASLVRQELESYVTSTNFDELLRRFARAPVPWGAPAGTIRQPLTIGWGRRDRIAFPSQAALATTLFPDARLHWFDDCGHFPHWDRPHEALRLIEDTLSAERPPPISTPLPAINRYIAPAA